MIAARGASERTEALVRAIRSLIAIAFDGEQRYDDAALVASSPETRALAAALKGYRRVLERARAARHDRSPASIALDFVRRRHCMTLATNGEGGPWAATVMYVSDGFELYFLSRPGSRHARDLAADPRVAVAINEDCATWSDIQGVQLEGRAERIAGVSQRAAIVGRFLARHPSTRPALAGEAADLANDAALLLFRIVPARVLYLDNRALPNGRVEINLR